MGLLETARRKVLFRYRQEKMLSQAVSEVSDADGTRRWTIGRGETPKSGTDVPGSSRMLILAIHQDICTRAAEGALFTIFMIQRHGSVGDTGFI